MAAQKAMERFQAGDNAGAVAIASSALREDPNDPELWNLLGIGKTELRDMQGAEEAFAHGLKLAPGDASLNENAGLLYFRENKYRDAERYLAKAVASGSSKPGVLFSLAAAELRTGQAAEARRRLESLEPSLGDKAEYWEERGRAELSSDAAAAEASFKRALGLEPNSLGALNGAASAAEKQGLDEKALAYLIRGRQAGPQDVATLMHFASVCIRRDLGPDAISALEEAQRLDPENASVQYLLARANIAVENWQKSYDLFAAFSKRFPSFAAAYYAMGWLDIRLNRPQEARKQLQHCLQLAPAMSDARYELAQLEFDDGNLDVAEKLLKEVLRQNPRQAKAGTALSDIVMRRGNLAEAERLLESAIRNDPKLAAAHYKLATVYLREHRIQAAEAEKLTAAKLNAETKKASRTQLRLVLPESAER